jgi:hypothetical protein
MSSNSRKRSGGNQRRVIIAHRGNVRDRLLSRSARIEMLLAVLAQGIEAQSATTAGRGPQDESPVPQGCAPTPAPKDNLP